MVSKEPNHLPSANSCSNSNSDKTVTVRSVLLNRDSPDIETRLKRRRNRTQQVRFKDLDDGGCSQEGGRRRSGAEQGSPHPNRKSPLPAADGRRGSAGEREAAKEMTANGGSVVGAVRGDMEGTIGAVAAILARAPPHPLTPAPMRRAWAPPRPCSLTLPNPRRPCMSTAIQTSPSLQKPLPLSVARTRSHSLGDFGGVEGHEEGEEGETQDGICPQNHVLTPANAQDCSNNPCSCQSNFSPRRPLQDGFQCLGPRADVTVSPPLVANSRHGTPAPNHGLRQQGVEPPPCPPTSPVMNSNGPPCATPPQSRKKRLGRAVSDPGKTVLPPTSAPPSALAPKSLPRCTSPPKSMPSCVLTPQTVPPGASAPKSVQPCTYPPETVSHRVSAPQSVPSSTMPPQNVPPCVSPLQTVPSCALAPKSVQPCTLPPQTVSHRISTPQTVPSSSIPPQAIPPCVSPPQTGLPCTLPPQTVPACVSPPQTGLPCTLPPQTVPACVSPPQTGLPCTFPPQIVPPKTVPLSASPPQTVLPCSSPPQNALPSLHPQTVPPCTSPPQAPRTTQDTWRVGERERRDRRESPLPPPPPPPPPYTPRREGCCTSGPTPRTEPPTRGGGGERETARKGSTPSNDASHTHPRRAGTPSFTQRQDLSSPPAQPGPQPHNFVQPPPGAQHTIFCTEPQANTPNNPHEEPLGQRPPPGSWDLHLGRTTDATLTPGQAETLKQVQELLGGLVSGARGKLELAKAREKLLGPQGPLHDIGTLQSQLQSLEGVLETSQNTIKVLLDVIQDLEKKEAERDGGRVARLSVFRLSSLCPRQLGMSMCLFVQGQAVPV
ncbi:proline-rich protein 36 isoform X2 [Megalops cyprinoides]|uniref:proline-rich protein 36 isoform X2 n=1 Tax=Megalops cyprinoides TaxID=118141 RepID=UPI0018647D75|nr:proline-rich protein 36 isoform X2 [Megalops cyprinoides]